MLLAAAVVGIVAAVAAVNDAEKQGELREAQREVLKTREERMDEEVKLEKAKMDKAKISIKGPTFHEGGSAEGQWRFDVDGSESAMEDVVKAIVSGNYRSHAIKQ